MRTERAGVVTSRASIGALYRAAYIAGDKGDVGSALSLLQFYDRFSAVQETEVDVVTFIGGAAECEGEEAG